jgi:hypothetical protein
LTTVLVMIACIVSMSLMTRVATTRHNPKIEPIRLAFRFTRSHEDRPPLSSKKAALSGGCVPIRSRGDLRRLLADYAQRRTG